MVGTAQVRLCPPYGSFRGRDETFAPTDEAIFMHPRKLSEIDVRQHGMLMNSLCLAGDSGEAIAELETPCSPKSTCCFWKRSGAWPSAARPTPMEARGSSALRRTCPSNYRARAGSRRGVDSDVGWVERSETHRGHGRDDGYRFAPPILRRLAVSTAPNL